MQLSHPYQLVVPYTQFMALVLAFIDPEHITLFGLGGGSLLRGCHHLLPNCRFSVVELRQTVINIARDYFLLPNDHRVSITIDDAFKAISRIKSHSSDIIFADMYDAYRMAPAQIQQSFLTECSRVLSCRGWMVINLHRVPDDRATFFGMLGELFPTVMLSSSTDNVVLFVSHAQPEDATPDPLRIETMEEHLQQPFSPLMSRVQSLLSVGNGVSPCVFGPIRARV